MADIDGLAAVSIRRIAQDFGVTPMALYWHVKNKDELLAAMGDRILSTIEMPTAEPDLGIEQLRELLTVLVAALHRHPGCTDLAMVRILQCDIGQQLSERALDILRAAGFSVQQSADLARAALQTAIMLVSGRPGAETLVPRDERETVMAGKRAALYRTARRSLSASRRMRVSTDRLPRRERLLRSGNRSVPGRRQHV